MLNGRLLAIIFCIAMVLNGSLPQRFPIKKEYQKQKTPALAAEIDEHFLEIRSVGGNKCQRSPMNQTRCADCNTVELCVDGVVVYEGTCKPNTLCFNGECTEYVKPLECDSRFPMKCPEGAKNLVLPSIVSAEKYYICNGLQATSYNCPEGQRFDLSVLSTAESPCTTDSFTTMNYFPECDIDNLNKALPFPVAIDSPFYYFCQYGGSADVLLSKDNTSMINDELLTIKKVRFHYLVSRCEPRLRFDKYTKDCVPLI